MHDDLDKHAEIGGDEEFDVCLQQALSLGYDESLDIYLTANRDLDDLPVGLDLAYEVAEILYSRRAQCGL